MHYYGSGPVGSSIRGESALGLSLPYSSRPDIQLPMRSFLCPLSSVIIVEPPPGVTLHIRRSNREIEDGKT